MASNLAGRKTFGSVYKLTRKKGDAYRAVVNIRGSSYYKILDTPELAQDWILKKRKELVGMDGHPELNHDAADFARLRF